MISSGPIKTGQISFCRINFTENTPGRPIRKGRPYRWPVFTPPRSAKCCRYVAYFSTATYSVVLCIFSFGLPHVRSAPPNSQSGASPKIISLKHMPEPAMPRPADHSVHPEKQTDQRKDSGQTAVELLMIWIIEAVMKHCSQRHQKHDDLKGQRDDRPSFQDGNYDHVLSKRPKIGEDHGQNTAADTADGHKVAVKMDAAAKNQNRSCHERERGTRDGKEQISSEQACLPLPLSER